MSNYETVKIGREGPVAIVTLNRPAVLNAFNTQMQNDIRAAVEEVNADENIRVAILTGEGRAFSAGADLSESLPDDYNVESVLNQSYKPSLMAITNAPKPWISAVRGAAAGIASAYAMNCDLTVMSEDAYLYQAFTAISLIPDGGATWHLARTVGRKKAYELIAGGEKLKAHDCLALGLCNRVVANESLIEETLQWANELAAKAPLSLRYAKEALNAAMTQDVGNTISSEARLQNICMNSEDAIEGTAAFIEKRKPVFKGR